jgi:hypothetical protein
LKQAAAMEYTEDQFLFPLVTEPRSRWEKAGLSPRQERSFNRVSTLLVALFVTGWLYSIFLAPARTWRPPAGGADQLRAGALAAQDAPPRRRLTEGMVRRPSPATSSARRGWPAAPCG